MDEREIAAAALQLNEAERSRVQARQLTLQYPGMTIGDAYRVQKEWVRIKEAAGDARRGRKIGLTSRAMQQAVNINEPDHGVLLESMFFEDNCTVPSERFMQLRVEAELAFILKTPLEGRDCTIFDVFNATDYVTPAIELLDARTQRIDAATGKTRTVVDTIADNAANAGIILGGCPFRPQDRDLRRIGASLSRNAMIEETGLAAGVLGHPATGVVWLVRRLAKHGERLEAGDVVLSGSFIRPVDVRPGDTFCADFGELGSVSFHAA